MSSARNGDSLAILLCNDDGAEAAGIRALERALADLGEVWVITPDRERSATSHALSIRESLRLVQLAERRFTLSGYPADCANVGLYSGRFPDFDLIVSGVNHGPNLGDDVHYSGTVAAARQGAVHNRKAVAISAPAWDPRASMERPARWLRAWLGRMLPELKRGIVYNVNYPEEPEQLAPDAEWPALRWTYQGRRSYHDRYDELEVEGRAITLRMANTEFGHVREDFSDFEAVLDGCVSVTPLSTYTTHIRELKRWFPTNPDAKESSSNAS